MSKALRVAVTGGSGRVGSFVVKELASRGHTVLNLDRRQASKPVDGVKFVCIDLRRREIVQPVLETVDVVCHLGEIPSQFGPGHDEVFYTNTNIGSVVMQSAADLKLKHLVYTSSCQVYGVWGGNVGPVCLPMDETHPVQPQNVYALSKVANESYARWTSREYGLSVSIFRPPAVHDNIEPAWFDWIEQRSGGPGELATYVHATDLATAYALAVEKAIPGCNDYHFSADEVISAEPLAAGLARCMPTWPSLPRDWPAYKSPVLTEKAKNLLGWQPKHNFLDDYRKNRGHEPLWKPRVSG